MKIPIEVEIDEEAYAEEYGLPPDQVRADAEIHLKDLLEGKLIQLGYASKEMMEEHFAEQRSASVAARTLSQHYHGDVQ